jgi:hypothetical protein
MPEVGQVADREIKSQFFGFNGAWMPDKDPAVIGADNFSTLQNLRYGNRTPIEAVRGYSKINTTLLEAGGGNDANTIILVQSYTTDGSTDIVDSAVGGDSNPYPITVVGNTHHETDEQKFSTTSIAFDGTGDYFEIDDHADLDTLFAAGNWTIDLQVYHTEAIGNVEDIISRYKDQGVTAKTFIIRRNATGNLNIFASSNGSTWDIMSNVTSTETISSNTWHHIMVARSGDVLYAFLDGTALTLSSSVFSGTMYASTQPIRIGVEDPDVDPQYFEGYMEEIRFSDTARNTTGFTAPTTMYST